MSSLPQLPAAEPWMSWEESPKAWMSVRDAELLAYLLVAHALRLPAAATVLEWGAGRSTLHFSAVLEERGLLGRWLALEHNRDFFLEEIEPAFARRENAGHRLIEDLPDPVAAVSDGMLVEAVVFDAGDLRPYDEDRPEDRRADLDAYVGLPRASGARFDIVIVDGRKRRRCLLEAAELLSGQGIAILHDAWRTYYHCAFEAFSFRRRIGDMLWVGAQSDPELESILPGHAFENHASGD